MNKLVLMSMLALTASAFADDELVAANGNGQSKKNGWSKKQDKDELQKKREKKEQEIVVLTSARPESGHGWYLFADALYWHASVGNSDWGARVEQTTVTATHDNIVNDVHHMDFGWDWGFKAGIGVNMCHDMWDTSLTYTWFHTKQSDTIKVATGLPATVVQDINTFLPATHDDSIVRAKHKWAINFSMFDWMLGRWQYSSKRLALHPHVGLKGGWIHQDRRTSMRLDDDALRSGRFKNHFWGIGPSAGVNTLWILGSAGKTNSHRFSLFGDAAGAIMYGHFKTTYSSTDAARDVKVKGLSHNLATPMLETALGFAWDTGFSRDRAHFTMKLGYELQYWFKQNQFFTSTRFEDQRIQAPERYSDDLALQGATLELRFDF